MRGNGAAVLVLGLAHRNLPPVLSRERSAMEAGWSGCVRAISCVFVLFVVLSARAYDSDSESLEDVVRTLKGQVNALLERRQEDFRILEDSIRRSLDKNTGLASVKSELDELRREIDKIRGGPRQTLNEQKNDHLTVQWLSTAVSEIRAELAEISVSYNSSAEQQQSQELSTGLDLLRGDVASFRRDLEELRAEQQQTVVTLGQLKQDVESSIENSQKAMANSVGAKSDMERIKTEMTTFMKSLNKMAREVKLLRTFSSKDYDSENATLKKYRHHRVLRQQVLDLERGTRELHTSQSRLEKAVHTLEKRMKSIGRVGFVDNEAVDERLVERVARLEEAGRSTVRQMFNVTSQVSELNRLHMSMLQLLESVETLENKMDKDMPELQREISKMEFNMAQTTSTLAVVKEDQSNQRSTLKNLGSVVSRLEERLDIDHGHITSLQAQLLNATMKNWYKNDTIEAKREKAQDSRIAALEEKLETHIEEEDEEDFESPATAVPEIVREETVFNRSTLPELIHSLRAVQEEYINLVHQLPHDCGAIDGKSGIYAIAPGEGPPLLVSCDMITSDGGWTVVQRRIDGSQDFNRKWGEYAEGFGAPSGELWLGNEALHRLTAENCSSLRVEITDIYGKKWLAEYRGFHISDASDGYRIHVFGYSGNASDALEYQNKMQFSAVDSDRDISNTHCAQNYKGGWWFSHCQHANLNGRYNLGLTWFDATRNEWIAVAFSEMKVRRRKNCDT